MTLAELHPEEMLDGARHGALNPEAALDLDAHLRRCSACHLQVQLGQDAAFEGRLDGHDRALHARLVAIALRDLDDDAGQPPLSAEAAVAFVSGSRSAGAWAWPVLRRLVLSVACILLGGGVATAMWSVTSNTRRASPVDPSPVTEPVGRPRARPVAALSHHTPRASLTLAVPATAPEPSERPRSRAHTRDVTTTDAMIEPAPALTAGGVFRQANDLRRAGDHLGALLRYHQLRQQFPGSREEITARVIAGQQELEAEAPLDALAQFDSYLEVSPNGTLAEEARLGRARALGALSRTEEERDAWRNLIVRHPSSIHIERARARLRRLGQ
jgi:TolA-binding protein